MDIRRKPGMALVLLAFASVCKTHIILEHKLLHIAEIALILNYSSDLLNSREIRVPSFRL